MESYLEYLTGIVGAGDVIPLMFIMAIVGPFVMYKLLHTDLTGRFGALKWLIAAMTFLSCLVLFVGTGGYIGSLFDVTTIGMGVGLVAFYYSFDAFTSLLPSTCQMEKK